MRNSVPKEASELEAIEQREWRESLEYVIQQGDRGRVQRLLAGLRHHARMSGVSLPFTAVTAYVNSIRPEDETPLPGSQEIERRIKSLVRWNAMAMVVRANRLSDGIGGHISTYASAATLYEVGFNHFFKGKKDNEGDIIYFQGHASPGIYARAYLEGRISRRAAPVLPPRAERQRTFVVPASVADAGLLGVPDGLDGARPDHGDLPGALPALPRGSRLEEAEPPEGVGLPRRRRMRRAGVARRDQPCGAREAREPHLRHQLQPAAARRSGPRQRPDHPGARGGVPRRRLERDQGDLGQRLGSAARQGPRRPPRQADGRGRRRPVPEVRRRERRATCASISSARIRGCSRWSSTSPTISSNGFASAATIPEKVYNAYKAAVEHTGQPTVILARTIKGYGLGEAGEGKNITHQQKKLNEADLRSFRTRFGIPISDDDIAEAPFYRPADDSPELQYLRERRKALGGFVPSRSVRVEPMNTPLEPLFEEFFKGTEGRKASTTMVFVRMLSKLLRDKEIGDLIVPIVPDEARTFGMESLFRAVGIYSHVGQKYEPVDMDTLLYYKEAQDGQILEEGITEAGSLSSFIAAGTAYSTYGVNTIPFFIFYSMFGFQRVADLIWAGADSRMRGFLLGATAGRTTLAGEGLQHQDGQSHVYSLATPNCISYDPAYAYELAVIIQDGIRRMYKEQESIFYYLTVMNEQYEMPAMPEGAREGIVKGMYRFSKSANGKAKLKAQLLGSGTILNEVIAAAKLLENYGVAADVWSVTSYNELYRDAHGCERWNMLHPGEKPKVPYVTQCLEVKRRVSSSRPPTI